MSVLGLDARRRSAGSSAGALLAANNLSDLAASATARTNLGLGTAAVCNTGTAAGNVPVLGTGGVLALAPTGNTSAITVTGYTVTASAPVLDLSQTWNNAGVTFTGIKLNVTDTASAAGSFLLDLQVGGSSRFNIKRDGGTSFYSTVDLQNSTLSRAGYITFGAAADLYLVRDGTDVLGLRRGANAQMLQVYNTFTDTSNYEKAYIGWSGNVFTVAPTKLGTGTYRSMTLGGNTVQIATGGTDLSGSTIRWVVNASGNLLAQTDNGPSIGASGANRPSAIYVAGGGTFGGTLTGNDLQAASTRYIFWNGRTSLSAPSDGVLVIQNNSLTDLSMVKLGGTNASFPALKRSSAVLQGRLADDSAFCAIQGKLTTDTNYTAGAITDTGYLTIYDATGTAYKVACVAA